MEVVKDRSKREGILERREIINLCELLFNLGSSKSLLKEFSLNTLATMIEPLRRQFVENLEILFTKTNKIQILKAVWGLARLGLVQNELYNSIEKGFTSLRPELLDEMNIKDLQTVLESIHFLESECYNTEFVDKITMKLIKLLDESKKGELNNQTMHSLFKSYKVLRYGKSDIFEKLTEVMIEKIKAGNYDE